jgi:hypothetical protein
MTEPDPNLHSLYTALWITALRGVTEALPDLFSDDLDEIAVGFFARFPPLAKA